MRIFFLLFLLTSFSSSLPPPPLLFLLALLLVLHLYLVLYRFLRCFFSCSNPIIEELATFCLSLSLCQSLSLVSSKFLRRQQKRIAGTSLFSFPSFCVSVCLCVYLCLSLSISVNLCLPLSVSVY